MFKKTKEKINQNKFITFIKEMWKNKRYRALFILILYFIFFFLILSGLRVAYQNDDNQDNGENTNVVASETMKEQYNNLKDYSYQVLVNDDLLIEGSVKESINNFKYNGKDYTIILDSIYEKKGETLKKIESLNDKKIIVPADKLMINRIMDYIIEMEPVKQLNKDGYEVCYDVPLGYFDINNEKSTEVCVFGNKKIDKITIDLGEYSEEYYKITVIVGDYNE